jgi:hypothetical protein
MDLNRLYSDHQLLLMRADHALNDGAQRVHAAAASHLARQIGHVQRALGAAAAPTWETLAAPACSSLASPGRSTGGYAS